jgi:hypothetical protein
MCHACMVGKCPMPRKHGFIDVPSKVFSKK